MQNVSNFRFDSLDQAQRSVARIELNLSRRIITDSEYNRQLTDVWNACSEEIRSSLQINKEAIINEPTNEPE